MGPLAASLLGLFGCLRPASNRLSEDWDDSLQAAATLDDAISYDWQSVPDDVLQAVLAYLTPADVAVARLTCRHWRAVLSWYTPHLTLPTRFLSSKGARTTLRRTSRLFPSLTGITLQHADGWCDPVQARLDVESMVQLETRSVSLEALGTGFSQLKQLCIHDATFTRDPWSLAQLAWLPNLSHFELCWDSALWAPGQLLQEAQALQPVFEQTQLTALRLSKNAHLFLGQVPLADAVLTAAASLRQLARLDLTTVRTSDEGFASLAGLSGLTHLSLRGHLNVRLATLSEVFAATTRLCSLDLECLVPSNRDLKRISAAHSGSSSSSSTRQQGGGSSRSSSSDSNRSSRSRTGQGTPASGASSSSSSRYSKSSSCPQQQQRQQRHQQHLPRNAAACLPPLPPSRQQQQPPSPEANVPQSSSTNKPSSTSRHRSTSSSSGSSSAVDPAAVPAAPSFNGSDWSAVLLPLKNLKSLRLQSDYVLLGGCESLRSMKHITHLELHGGAKFLSAGPFASLPSSWLNQQAPQFTRSPRNSSCCTAATAATATANDSSSSSSSQRVPQSLAAPDGGCWPGLVSLHVDNLQLADGLVEAVAHLQSLQTLIISGPCLLAAAQQQQQPNEQEQQQPPPAAAGMLSRLPGLDEMEASWLPKQQQQQEATGAANTAEAATAEGGGGSGGGGGGSSGLSSVSLHTKGSQQQRQQPPPQQQQHQTVSGTEPQQGLVYQTLADPDLLTRLSPLYRLSRFEMHQQQHLPCGLSMTPFAISVLGATWCQLSALSLDIPAPVATTAATTAAAAAAGQAEGCVGIAASRYDSSAAAQLMMGLSAFSCLKNLNLRLAGPSVSNAHLSPAQASGDNSLTDVGAPSGPEAGQEFENEDASVSSLYSSPSGSQPGHQAWDASSLTAAVRTLPWTSLPASLESLSLSGFVGMQPENVSILAAAAPNLRHLRLMRCHTATAVLWALQRQLPLLSTLIVKEGTLGGVGSSGVAAVAGLKDLRALGLTLEPGANVSALGELHVLRYLLLDGRSNTPLAGIKALRKLQKLKTLVMPLLHLHHNCKSALVSLQLALPNVHMANVSRNLGVHHGCQWFKAFNSRERDWWAEPDHPWTWYPTLDILS